MKKIYLIGTIIGLSIITMFTSLSVFANPISDLNSTSPDNISFVYVRGFDNINLDDHDLIDKKDLESDQYFDIFNNEIWFGDYIRTKYDYNATTLIGLGVYDLYLGVYGLWDDLPMHKEFKLIDNGYHIFDFSADIVWSAPNNSKWDSFDWGITFEYTRYHDKDNYLSFTLTKSYINDLLTGVNKDDNEQPYLRFQFKDTYDIAYEQGFNDGYQQGFSDGLGESYQYDKGFNDGYQQGYDVGYNEALNIGQTMGYNEARDFYGYYDGTKWYDAKTWGELQFSKGQTSETNYFSIMFTGFFSFITLLGGIELLPGLYIWHFVVFPLVFGIIFFIIGRSGGDNKGGKK